MRLSEVIARGERYVDMVRDFKRGAKAVAVAVPKASETITQLGRLNAQLRHDRAEQAAAFGEMQAGNGRLNAEACDLRTQATKDWREIAKLKDKLQAAERQVEAHRETIRGYFEKLDAEARKGNPNGQIAPADSDSK